MGLLAQRPMHGYDLKLALDQVLGRTSPVNVGQVYTAISKLEKEGLITGQLVARDERSETKVFSLTPMGEAELHRWFATPVEKADLRDELFLKLSLARRRAPAEALAIIRTQRAANLGAIQELTMLAGQYDPDSEVTLLIEGAILRLEADLRWLDLWESRIR